ncbi:MAG: methylated-DNA--[protein]-cysteine S-methyltransferase [Candidatus Bathyarchaeales archaeon]
MIGLFTKNIDGVWFGAACNNKEVFAVSFAFSQKEVLKSLLNAIPYNTPFQQFKETSTLAGHVLRVLKDVYDGKGADATLPLNTKYLSEYVRRVIAAVSAVPLGYVTSYGSVAKVAGGSPRAVGRVMAFNPFPLIVPCHRVVSWDFTLGGYGGGLNIKLAILSREKQGYSVEAEVSVGDGGKLRLFPVEFVLSKLERIGVKE